MEASARTLRSFFLACGVCVLASAGCAWKPYVVIRGTEFVIGARTRLHVIKPIAASLKAYRVLEIRPVENLLPGTVPSSTEEYFNGRLMREFAALKSLRPPPTIVSLDGDANAAVASVPLASTLVLQTILDDYEPGNVALRAADMGFNHVAVTLRIQLRDKKSGEIVAAASLTAQDNRPTGTAKGALNRLAKSILAFVRRGYQS